MAYINKFSFKRGKKKRSALFRVLVINPNIDLIILSVCVGERETGKYLDYNNYAAERIYKKAIKNQ